MGKDNILIYPVGKKVADALIKQGYAVQGDFQHMADKPSFADASVMAQELMDLFAREEIDRVEILYHHFKSTASQILTHEVYLPMSNFETATSSEEVDYILEPSREELLTMLLPKVLRMKLYTVLVDSNASEHAARTFIFFRISV